jgi:hypothetical protein
MANKIFAIVYEAESIGVKFAVQCFCAETHTLQLQKEKNCCFNRITEFRNHTTDGLLSGEKASS